jgi:signal transduction histidine kinase
VGLAFARIRRRTETLQVEAARAERERIEAAERAAADERARIARELHDVISHDVSMMVLQASVERRVHTGDGSTAQTLANIETTGREALAELRRMLGVLRKDDGNAPLRPQPGLAELPDLVEQARAAGVPVELIVEGEPASVPPGLDIAADRIVQESITNAAKHAAGATVTATLRYADGALEIDVVNGGAARPVSRPLPHGGHGLAGMRERVALFGGSLDTASGDDGGFRVRARLPLPAGPSPSSSPMTRRWSGPGSAGCSSRSRTSTSSATPRTAPRPWSRSVGSSPRSPCSTSACRTWTASPRHARSCRRARRAS